MQMVTSFLAGAAAATVAAVLSFLWWRNQGDARAEEVDERTRLAERRAYAENLTGGLIHEIKNPLNTLSLNLQLLAEDWARAETQEERRALKRIQRLQTETKRLDAILNDFKGFVRDQKLRLVESNLNELIEELVTFVQPELDGKGIRIRASYGIIARCMLDRNLVKQALLNLILNAEQALTDSSPREIILRTEAEGNHVRIDVIDTGKGIAPTDREKIFKVFYSTRKGGTGLGLPATRRIVEELGGTIEVHSDHGRGTCFTLRLPAVGNESELRKKAGEA